MNKKTIVIVSLTLVLALLAVAVIATFPTYLFEDTVPEDSSSIQSDVITESESTVGDDVGNLAGDDDQEIGVEGVLPMPDDTAEEDSTPDNEEPTSPETEKPAISDIKVDELEMLASAKNMKVYAQYGAYPDGTKVKIKKLGAFDKAFYRARHYLKGISKEFTAYNFSATKDKQAAYPIATVKLSFEIPKGYNSENIAVYYLTSKNLLKLDFEISKDGKTITVDATQNGVYIFAEKTVSSDATSSSTESNKETSSETSKPSSDNSQTSSTESTSSTTSDKNNTSSEADSNNQTSSNTSSEATSSNTSSNEDTSSEPTSSNTSSEEDTSSEATSSSTSSEDTSSETDSSESSSSDNTSSDTSSEEDTGSDNTSSVDPNKDSMNGWTPWQ